MAIDTSLAAQREKTSAEHGHAVTEPCEKCGVIFDYKALTEDILNSEELTVEEKATALSNLTKEFEDVASHITEYYPEYDEKAGKRMSKQQVSKLQGALDTIKNLFKWANYEEDDHKEEDVTDDKEPFVYFKENSGFKVISTKTGPRWLAYSSNAFEDLDGELFTTKALEEAVEYADNSGDRGPLRVFHVPGADIGDTDFQAVAGRYLVESGTFRDDELGTAALEYFERSTDKYQISIGFQYKVGDERDGIFDWLRIRERSVLPEGDAANPFTSFAFGEIGGIDMDERKMKMLEDIFGSERASKIVGEAEARTKENVDRGVAFKALDLLEDVKKITEKGEAITVADLDSLVEKYSKKKMDDEEEDPKKDPKEDEKKEAESAVHIDAAALEPVTIAIQALADRLDTFKGSFETLEGEVKALKEKEAGSPRGKTAYRGSEATDNLLNPDKLKELVGDDDDKPVNPATPYIDDLLKLGATS